MKKILKYLFILLFFTALAGFILYYNAGLLFVYAVENGNVLAMKLALQFKINIKMLVTEHNEEFLDKIANDVNIFKLVIENTKRDIENYTVMRYALKRNSKDLVQCVLNEVDFTDYDKECSFLDDDIVKARDPEIFKLLNSHKFNLSNVIIKKMILKEYSDVKEVFESNRQYDIRTKNGLTPLMCAVINRDHDMLDFLIFNKADVNASYQDGDTPLFMAIRNKPDFRVIKTLIENGADIDIKNKFFETPLELLVENPGNDVIIKYLIEKGADIDGKVNAYSRAVLLNMREYARMIVESGLPVNAINISDQGENDGRPEIDSTLKKSTNINETSNIYSNLDNFDKLKEIVVSIDDPDKKSRVLKSILLNINNMDEYFLKFLIEQGADITVTDSEENTLLMKAVDSNNIDNFRLLIDCGIDVNACNKSGETALIKLVKNKRGVNSITAILNAGADVNIRDAYGKDVFYYNNHNENNYYYDSNEILKLLQPYKVPVSRELFKKRKNLGYNKMTYAQLKGKFEDAVENNNLESAEIYLGSYLYNNRLDRMNMKIIKSNNMNLIKLHFKNIETYCVNSMINGFITEAVKQSCELSVLKYLLNSERFKNESVINESVIIEAIAKNNIEALKLLLSKKIDSGSDTFNYALMYAIERKNIEAVKIIAGIISENIIDSACISLSYRYNRYNKWSSISFPLVMAIIGENDEIARILLEKKMT